MRPPASILAAVLASLGRNEQMQIDLVMLDRARRAPQDLVLPAGAPRPAAIAQRAEF
jgi:hypothetical protein